MRMLQEILGYFLIGLVGFAGLAIFCLPFCLFVRKKKKVSLVRQSAWIILVAGALVVL